MPADRIRRIVELARELKSAIVQGDTDKATKLTDEIIAVAGASVSQKRLGIRMVKPVSPGPVR